MTSHGAVPQVSRRVFLGGAAAAVVSPGVWAAMISNGGAASASFLDDLQPPDELGLRLPPGFSAKRLARSGDRVGNAEFVWHSAPDGGAVIPRPDSADGWSYVSNSELNDGRGGVSVLDFDRCGDLIGARPILAGTSRNCAGGVTPWGTWLSCEEVAAGRVHEVDPFGPTLVGGSETLRPTLGTFNHEAAVVDERTGCVLLTEDDPIGRLYRFVPSTRGQVMNGSLFAASVSKPPADIVTGERATVSWVPTSPDEPDRAATTSAFDGGEGAWIDGRRLLFTTKGDSRVWQLELDANELSLLHDCIAAPDTPLDDVDNIVVHPHSGDIYVAEDTGNMQLCAIRELANGELEIRAALQIVGQDSSEITGPAFSPDGSRLYVSSQRGGDGRGETFEITGPFAGPQIATASACGLRPAVRIV